MGWTSVLLSCLIVVGVGVLFTREPFSNHAQQLVQKLHNIIEPLLGGAQGQSKSSSATDRLFTKEEIADYDGRTKSQIYLAVVGNVYDVTKGERFYAAGNHYGGFSGNLDQYEHHPEYMSH